MRRRASRIVVFAVAASSVLPLAFAPTASADGVIGGPTSTDLTAFLDRAVAQEMSAAHVPGAVVAVVRDGNVIFTKGYGVADVARQTPVDPARTLFRLASVSKLFTWTAVMQLVEQGRLDLDADVNSYLDFAIPSTFATPITMRNLLGHTGGFEDANMGMEVAQAGQLTTLGAFLRSHMPARAFPPGAVPSYSNYGAALAGYIVERIAGEPFADYAAKHVFEPLRMDHTTFAQPLPAALAQDMAGGYAFLDGLYKPGPFALDAAYPAGAASSTAEDVASFMLAQLGGGEANGGRILAAPTVDRMHTLVGPVDARLTDGMAYGFLRWHVNGTLDLWHDGSITLFHTELHLLPEHGVGFFIANNGLDGGGLGPAVYQQFVDRYYPGPERGALAAVASPTRPDAVDGEYLLSRANLTGIERLATLFDVPIEVSASGDGRVTMSNASGTAVWVETAPGILTSMDRPGRQMAVGRLPDGRAILVTDGPRTFVQARWYESHVFHLLVVVASVTVLLLTLAAWSLSALWTLLRRRGGPIGPRLARATAAVFPIGVCALLAALVALVSDADPVTGNLAFLLEAPSRLPVVVALAFGLLVVAVLMAAAGLLAWRRGYWGVRTRLHYTVVTVAAWAMVWELAFWNVLRIPAG
jgi:CubicO group peptidase (beta-lactamase class C family)